MNHQNQVATLKALAHDVRLQVVKELSLGEKAVGDLNASDQSQSSLSQHLKVLRKAGIVTTERKGTKIIYSLNQENECMGMVREIVEGDVE